MIVTSSLRQFESTIFLSSVVQLQTRTEFMKPASFLSIDCVYVAVRNFN